MPTPVGPTARDPDDPDQWDWGAFEDTRPQHTRVRRVLVAVVVLALVALLVVSIL
jgi:hypothetical protein